MKDGAIIEDGTFDDLMTKKSYLASYIAGHTTLESVSVPKRLEVMPIKFINHANDDEEQEPVKLPLNSEAVLTDRQIANRKRLTLSGRVIVTDDLLSAQIENNQMRVTIDPLLKKRISFVTHANHPDEPVPEDADPVKLVLDDQSIFYKENPLWSYMKAGSGVTVSIAIVILFFLVHVVRIGSGK